MFSLKTSYFLNEKVANFPPGGDVMQTSWRLPLRPLCLTMCDKIIMSQTTRCSPITTFSMFRTLWQEVVCCDLKFWLKQSVSDFVRGRNQSFSSAMRCEELAEILPLALCVFDASEFKSLVSQI